MPLKSDFSSEDYKRLFSVPIHYDLHATRDNSTWDKVRRSSQSFWRGVQVIDMTKNSDGVWIKKEV